MADSDSSSLDYTARDVIAQPYLSPYDDSADPGVANPPSAAAAVVEVSPVDMGPQAAAAEPAEATADAPKNAQKLDSANWDEVIQINKLLHGFVIRTEVPDVVRARCPAFVLKNEGNKDHKPSFHVFDGSTIRVYETETAFQRSLAENAFSEKCIDTNLSAGHMGIEAGVSGGRGRKMKSASKGGSSLQEKEYHASYDFPRARLFLDEYELVPSDICTAAIEVVENKQTIRSLREFETKFGHVFVTSVVLGGQQRTVKSLAAVEWMTDEQKQDAVRAALGAKIVAPYVSGGFQFSKHRGTKSVEKNEEYDELAYLGMNASGGDTLIGADVSNWVKTVSAPENWRVIGNEIAVPIAELIASTTKRKYLPLLFLAIRKNMREPAQLSQLLDESGVDEEEKEAFSKWWFNNGKTANGKLIRDEEGAL